MNPTLDLRGLTEAERDAKVNIAIALIAGFTPAKSKGFIMDGWTRADEEHRRFIMDLPHYATSADTVLPLLEKKVWRSDKIDTVAPNKYRVEIHGNIYGLYHRSGLTPTFPLAACYALLRAHRIEVLT